MSNYVYRHAVIVGLDGMGSFNRLTSTPYMDRIFADYAQTWQALSLYPTISAQNWGAMLIGTDPDIHGLTNSIVSTELYTNKKFPSVFTTVRNAFPEAVLCSISNWEPINHGIIEHDVGVCMQTADNGEHTTDKIVKCVLEEKPKLLFVQIDDPDEAGHHYGYGTEGHLRCITDTDKLVNRIFEAYRDAGILDDTLFIVITDHGGIIKGHGGYSDSEKYIYFALRGKTVKNTKSFFAQTKDINAIIRHAFGLAVEQHDPVGYSSQIPNGVFTDHEAEYKSFTGKRYDVPNLPTPPLEESNGLLSFFDKNSIKLAMFFDSEAKDELGRVRFSEVGTVKYYSEGVRGARAELGKTGYLVSEDIKFGKDDFTFSMWLKVDDAPNGECFICSNKTMSDSGPGFTLGFTSAGTFLGIETEDPSTYFDPITPYFREVSGGWIHSVYSFNKKKRTVDVYHNFVHKQTIQLTEIFDISLDALPFTVGEEASHQENQLHNAIFNMDDLFIFNYAFSEEDVKKLAAYYQITP